MTNPEQPNEPTITTFTREEFCDHWGRGGNSSWAQLRKLTQATDCPLEIIEENTEAMQGDIEATIQWSDARERGPQYRPSYRHILARIQEARTKNLTTE